MRRLAFSRKSGILPLLKEIVHHKTVNPLSLFNQKQPPLLGLVRFSSKSCCDADYVFSKSCCDADYVFSKSCCDADYVFKFGFRSPLETARVYNNLFLQVFIERMDLENAMRLLSLMKENGRKPYACTYDELILGFHKVGKLDTASALLLEMLDQGFIPNIYHYCCLIDGLCKDGRVEAALLLLEKMEAEYDFWPETEAYNPIIYFFYKNNRLREAQELLEKILVFPDLIAYTRALVQNHNGLAFKELVEEGKRENCMLNVVLYGSVTYGLCSEGRVDEAKMLLDEMERKQVVVNYDVIYTSLIDGYVSLNRLDDAFLILKRMIIDRGLKPKYNNFRVLMKVLDDDANKLLVMMSEYTTLGELWNKMMEDDDGYMYVARIDAHYKDLNICRAIKLFDSIIKKGLEPHIGWYKQVISGLYKKGDIFKAISTYNKLLCRSNNVIEFVWPVFIDGVLDQLGVDEDECLDFTQRLEPTIHCCIPEMLLLEIHGSCDDSEAIDDFNRHVWEYLANPPKCFQLSTRVLIQS